MIQIFDGDLLESGAEVICHQVNCQGRMGSGIAKQIRNKYPEVYLRYAEVCSRATSSAILLGKAYGVYIDAGNKIVFNLFAQDSYGFDGKQYTNLEALKSCFIDVLRKTEGLEENAGHSLRIAIPYKIGCVRGGANWEDVYAIIEEVFAEHDVEIWRLDKG